MTITEALQDQEGDHSHVRVSCGDRWLVWYEDEWQVFEHRYSAKSNTVVLKTDNKADAVLALLTR